MVDDLEDYLSNDSTNISDMIDIKTYTFRELILEYGPEKMNTIKVKWNAPQQKFNIILGGVEVLIALKSFFSCLFTFCLRAFYILNYYLEIELPY